jgi:hypothetical protein
VALHGAEPHAEFPIARIGTTMVPALRPPHLSQFARSV